MPVPKEQIDQQLKSVKQFEMFFTKKEVQYLPEVIREGETIHGMVSGMYEGNTWLVVATDQRLLFLDKGMLYGLKQAEIPLSSISSIQHKTGMLFGTLGVTTSNADKKVDNIDKQATVYFAELLSGLIRSSKAAPSPTTARSATEDRIAQLERLAALKEKGILTDQEFQAEKAKILAS
jgi:hypothetical protein